MQIENRRFSKAQNLRRNENFMQKEDIVLLNQLVNSLDESNERLQEEYQRGNYNDVEAIKRFMKKLQEKIFEILEK